VRQTQTVSFTAADHGQQSEEPAVQMLLQRGADTRKFDRRLCRRERPVHSATCHSGCRGPKRKSGADGTVVCREQSVEECSEHFRGVVRTCRLQGGIQNATRVRGHGR
jgi:hypothetical protein